jgi:hypothetical protein
MCICLCIWTGIWWSVPNAAIQENLSQFVFKVFLWDLQNSKRFQGSILQPHANFVSAVVIKEGKANDSLCFILHHLPGSIFFLLFMNYSVKLGLNCHFLDILNVRLPYIIHFSLYFLLFLKYILVFILYIFYF